MVSSAGVQTRISSADMSHRAGVAGFYVFVNKIFQHNDQYSTWMHRRLSIYAARTMALMHSMRVTQSDDDC